MGMKVLVVEDEVKVAAFLKKGLEVKNFETDVACDGREGLTKARTGAYDAIILDINIPFINGLELCKKIRQGNSRTPILMLTALSTTRDKVQGFENGADDYLVKPFEFEELTARLKAIIKRASAASTEQTVLRIANLELNKSTNTVTRDGNVIDLTAKEFTLLEYMMRNRGHVLSRTEIAEKIWEISFDTGTNIIDLYIHYLRKKIDKNYSPKLIHTQVGRGYVLKEKV